MALVLNKRRRATLVFTTILRHVLTRLLAALIVILVLSPYSEPFATIHGAGFGGSTRKEATNPTTSSPHTATPVMLTRTGLVSRPRRCHQA